MKLIPLTRGYSAQVDDCDYDRLMFMKWFAVEDTRTDGSIRNVYAGTFLGGTNVGMHRYLLGIVEKGRHVMGEHRDGNGLNNKRSNIRICNNSQNQANCRPHSRSGFKGVVKHPNGRWMAYIKNHGVSETIGYYSTAKKAAMARDERAKELFGEFAYLNEALQARQNGRGK